MIFLRTELHTGLTMSRIAQSATNESKKRRNRINARKAYDTVLRFRKTLDLAPRDAAEISNKLEELRFELLSLGEKI